MLEALLGHIIATVWPYLLGAAGLAGMWLAARRGGRKAVEAQHNEDYRDERQQIDAEDLGLGASDRERIERLQRIADGRGAGKD